MYMSNKDVYCINIFTIYIFILINRTSIFLNATWKLDDVKKKK